MKKIFNYLYYLKDILFDFSSPQAKIDGFKFNTNEHNLTVTYRLGRQKFLNTSNLHDIEVDYYNKLSTYDKQRLTKFLTLQSILTLLREDKSNTKQTLIKHIQEEITHDKLL